MSKQKAPRKRRRKNRKLDTATKLIVLLAALIDLVARLVELIGKLTE